MLYMVLLYDGRELVKPILHNQSDEVAEQKCKEMISSGEPAFFLPQNSTHLMENAKECALCYSEICAALQHTAAGR